MPSGSKNLSVTCNDIIAAALKKAGVYQSGEQASPEEVQDAKFALNTMVKEWSALGIDVPWRTTITLFVQPGQQSYLIGPTGDNATSAYVETTLATAADTGAIALALTSITGMSDGDHIGIKLDSGVIHWSTLADAASVIIADGLVSGASAGNSVYAYTDKAYRPQKVIYALRRNAQGFDVEVTLIGDTEYQGLARKDQPGYVNQAYYTPTFDNGTLFVWATSGSDKLVLITQNLVDNFDALNDAPQFPIEWTNALVWNLASELSPDYGMPLKERMDLERRATKKLETLLDYDTENASVILSRNVR
jgi:hypothetical protein